MKIIEIWLNYLYLQREIIFKYVIKYSIQVIGEYNKVLYEDLKDLWKVIWWFRVKTCSKELKTHGICLLTPCKEFSLAPDSLPRCAEQQEAAPASLDMSAGNLWVNCRRRLSLLEKNSFLWPYWELSISSCGRKVKTICMSGAGGQHVLLPLLCKSLSPE